MVYPVINLINSYVSASQVLSAVAAYKIFTHSWGKTIDWLEKKTLETWTKYCPYLEPLRKIPKVGNRIGKILDKVQPEKQLGPALDEIEKKLFEGRQTVFEKMPQHGIPQEDLLKIISKFTGSNHCKDQMSGGLYCEDDEQFKPFIGKINEMASYDNPMHEKWKQLRQLETEAASWVKDLYHGTDVTGHTTTGGTQSILDAVRTHRNWAKETKNIETPNMVVPQGCHTSFRQAADYYGIEYIEVPVDPETMQADVKAMEKKIDSNTIMVVGSAPCFPWGVVDPIEDLAKLAQRKGIGCHVDACLGGFIVPFMEAIGKSIPIFDFRLPGVTSISADYHKYGQAPKGTSTVLIRNEVRRYGNFTDLDWPGGMMVKGKDKGSERGSTLIEPWAVMANVGFEGYKRKTLKIVELTEQIISAVKTNFPEVKILGDPKLSVFSIKTVDQNIDIYKVAKQMSLKGWYVKNLQNPAAMHFCFTGRHLQDEKFIDRFIGDLRESINFVMLNPKTAPAGDGATYNMLRGIPAFAKPIKQNIGREYGMMDYQTRPSRQANIKSTTPGFENMRKKQNPDNNVRNNTNQSKYSLRPRKNRNIEA